MFVALGMLGALVVVGTLAVLEFPETLVALVTLAAVWVLVVVVLTERGGSGTPTISTPVDAEADGRSPSSSTSIYRPTEEGDLFGVICSSLMHRVSPDLYGGGIGVCLNWGLVFCFFSVTDWKSGFF